MNNEYKIYNKDVYDWLTFFGWNSITYDWLPDYKTLLCYERILYCPEALGEIFYLFVPCYVYKKENMVYIEYTENQEYGIEKSIRVFDKNNLPVILSNYKNLYA